MNAVLIGGWIGLVIVSCKLAEVALKKMELL